jgi:hypothetical protein
MGIRTLVTRLALALLPVLFACLPVRAQSPDAPVPRVPIYFFWGDGCPHCATQKVFLAELAARHPEAEVREFEIWYRAENRPLFLEMARRAGIQAGRVPTTFIGNRTWVGFRESMKGEMEGAVVACIRSPCVDPGRGVVGGAEGAAVAPGARQDTDAPPVRGAPAAPVPAPAAAPPPAPSPAAADPPVSPAPAEATAVAEPDVEAPTSETTGAGEVQATATPGAEVLHVPLIGAISLGARSLAFSTAVIAFVDGFNPCSLWVLSILLALVLHTGSRRKIVLIGGTFLLVTSAVYGLFIVGLFRIFTVIDFMGPIQAIVALFALGFALVNIKDYFWYGRGFSFSISERHKPGIYRDLRGLLTPGKSTAGLLGATVVMALGIALIELPCTAGFPVLWSNLVASHAVGTLEFSFLLGLYLAIYLLDELVVFGTAVVTLKMSRMEEKHGRVLKLAGGMVMLALALVLLLDPGRMNTFEGSLVVFAAAFAATLLILAVHRWLPRPPAPDTMPKP